MKKILFLFTTFLSLSMALKGQITFQKTYGGNNSDGGQVYWSKSVIQLSDGCYVGVGYTFSFISGADDVYLIKTNSEGTLLWAKSYGGTWYDVGNSIAQTIDGGFIITGTAGSFGAGNYDVYLIKTDSSGNVLWSKTYGGVGDDRGQCVQQTNDGGFIIVGWTMSYGLGTQGSADIYLIKTSYDGTIEWTKTFGGINDDTGFSIRQTNDGGYAIVGSTKSFGEGLEDVYLLKTSSNGNLQWTKTFGGASTDWGNCLQQTIDGGFIICGKTFSFGAGGWDLYLIKTTYDGTLQWTKTFGGIAYDEGHFVQETKNGEFIIVGKTYSFGSGDSDVFLLKTNTHGSLLWAKTYGGINTDFGGSIQQTFDNGFIIMAETRSFGAGNNDIYLIKTDSIGNSNCNETSPIPNIGSGGIQGSTGGTENFGGVETNANTQTLTGGIETTICLTTKVTEYKLEESIINIFPNPTQKHFTIQLPTQQSFTLSVIDITGRNVYSTKNASGTISIDASEFSSGVYFVKAVNEKTLLMGKMVKE